MEAEKDSEDVDYEKIINDMDPEDLLKLLQSSEEDISPEMLDVLQQFKPGELSPSQASGGTQIVPTLNDITIKQEPCDVDFVSEEVEVPSAPTAIKEEKDEASVAPIVIIKSEEGITVCHDGGETLRPKEPLPAPGAETTSVPSTSHQLVEVKTEKVEGHVHHKRKDKKKDKDKDGKKKQKEKLKLKIKETRPPRHPDFGKYRKKYRLVDTSVTIIKIDTILPVDRHMRLKRRRLNRIEETDREQQAVVNQKDRKVRLVPLPRPANAPYKPDKPAQKQGDSKDKKRRKILEVSDSDSDKPSKQNLPSKKDKDHHKVTKPHGEFSARGTRILPFEKRKDKDSSTKEQERIWRPKKPEPQPDIKTERDSKSKRDRNISLGTSKEGEVAKVQKIIQSSLLPKKPKGPEASNSFRIPKNERQAIELNRTAPTSSTSLFKNRQEEKLNFNARQRPLQNNFPKNSYGDFKFNQQFQRPNEEVTSYGDHKQNRQLPQDDQPVDLAAYKIEQERRAAELRDRLALRAEADFQPEDIGLVDDDMSDDAEQVESPEAMPPVEEVTVGPLVYAVFKMLQLPCQYPTDRGGVIAGEPQTPEPTLVETTMQKIAWWLQGIDKEGFTPILPVPMVPETEDMIIIPNENGSVVSSFGNVSNPGDRDCQINEISSLDLERTNDPDFLDEYCGCTLINCEFRISADDQFQRIFKLKPGTNYDKENFQATCTICNEHIQGKRHLGRHLRSDTHRNNFKKISLAIMPNKDRKKKVEESPPPDRVPRDPSKLVRKSSDPGRSLGKELQSNGNGRSEAEKPRDWEKKSSKKRASRSRTRDRKSPGPSRRRTRSRSHDRRRTRSRSYDRHRRRSPRHRSRRSRSKSVESRRRRTSTERVAEFLEMATRPRRLRSRSPSSERKRLRTSSKRPPSIFSEKLKLQHEGKWTAAMEEKWKIMEAEESALGTEMDEYRKRYKSHPEDHPNYKKEWEKFWDMMYQELEAKGYNPKTYDFVPEFTVHWHKIVEEIAQTEHAAKLEAIRLKHGLDYASLQRILLDIPVVPVPAPMSETQILPTPPSGANEVYSLLVDDHTSRPMSLSMSGSNHSQGSREPRPPGVVSPPVPKSTVTTGELMKTWEKLTGAPSSQHSGEGSRTPMDSDLEMDLIQILRIMNGLEDQLSILAPLVNEYYIRAESLETSGRRSADLLEDKELVALLFQCRDKFMGLIRANILPRDVGRKVNRAVFGLTSLLDSEPCQRLRPKIATEPISEFAAGDVNVPPPSFQLEIPAGVVPGFEFSRRPELDVDAIEPKKFMQLNVPAECVEMINKIRAGVNQFPPQAAMEISSVITNAVLSARLYTLNDLDLVKYVYRVLEPAFLELNKRNSQPQTLHRSPSPLSSEEREAIRGKGTALPVLPEVRCRAISPAAMDGPHVRVQHYQQAGGSGRGARPSMNQFSRLLGTQNSCSSASIRGSPPFPGARAISPYSPGDKRLSRSPRGGNDNSRSPGARTYGYVPPHLYPKSTDKIKHADKEDVTTQLPQNYLSPSAANSTALPPEPQAGPSHRRRKGEAENMPPKQKKILGIAQEFWNLSGSSVSSASIAGADEDGAKDLKIKKPSKSTASNGSTRSKLREVQRVALAGLEDIVSEPESGEILSSDEISVHSNQSSVHKKQRRERGDGKSLTAEQKAIHQRISAQKMVEKLREKRRRGKKWVDQNKTAELASWFQRRRQPRYSSESTNASTEKSRRKRRHRSDFAVKESHEKDGHNFREKKKKKTSRREEHARSRKKGKKASAARHRSSDSNLPRSRRVRRSSSSPRRRVMLEKPTQEYFWPRAAWTVEAPEKETEKLRITFPNVEDRSNSRQRRHSRSHPQSHTATREEMSRDNHPPPIPELDTEVISYGLRSETVFEIISSCSSEGSSEGQ